MVMKSAWADITLGKRNNEEQAIVDVAKRMELAITNT